MFCSGYLYELTGNGYEPIGDFFQNGEKLDSLNDDLMELLLAGYLCNESYLLNKDSKYMINGDPTDGALIVSALKGGFDEYKLNSDYPRVDLLPFESDRQYMATLNKDVKNNQNVIYLKGSIEKSLKVCDYETVDGESVAINKEKILLQAEEYASKGLRVLAIAKKIGHGDRISDRELDKGFVFLGLVAMMDPPRTEAVDAVKECKGAGIKIIMITGDHALTAFSIAKMMSIVDENAKYEDSVLRGEELFKLSDGELIEKVATVKVFARVEHEQKLRIVDALQARGEIVAMTGD